MKWMRQTSRRLAVVEFSALCAARDLIWSGLEAAKGAWDVGVEMRVETVVPSHYRGINLASIFMH